jgi:hypothetical protein
MNKTVEAIFSLNEGEIKEALLDYFVKRLKENNIHSHISVNDINLESCGYAYLRIIENKEL